MKYHDLYMELSIPIIERDLQKRLVIINLLKNTDMWDEKEILDKKKIFIVVSNSVAERINTKSDFFMTSKKDKENHGFGLKNIAATVEKYHGECYMESIVENRETLFKISIAIPTAKAEEKEE